MKIQLRKFKIQGREGFTLFEMLVAISIFSISLLIAVSSLLVMTDAHRTANANQNIQDNIRFATEFMARQLRTAQILSCGVVGFSSNLDCVGGSNLLAFVAADGSQRVFRRASNRIQISFNGGATYSDITAPEARINTLTFYVVGGQVASLQKRSTVFVSGTVGQGTKNETQLRIQTTVTSRALDL